MPSRSRKQKSPRAGESLSTYSAIKERSESLDVHSPEPPADDKAWEKRYLDLQLAHNARTTK